MKAIKTLTADVTEPKSSLTMNDKTVAINGLNGNGTLTIEQGKINASSPEINLNAKAKLSASATEVEIKGKAKLSASATDVEIKGNAKLSAQAAEVSIKGEAVITANSLTLLGV